MQQTHPPLLHQTRSLVSLCPFENTRTAVHNKHYNNGVLEQTTSSVSEAQCILYIELLQFYKHAPIFTKA